MKGIVFLRYLNRKGALALVSALVLFGTGCPDITESDELQTGTAAGTELNTTALKASIIGNANATNFSHYLTKCFPNKSSRAAADTKVIVVTKLLDALDGSDLAAIKSVYDAGGAVVVVNPAADKLKEFQDAVGHSEGLDSAGVVVGAIGSFCDAYIFNNRGNHLVVDYTRSGREGYSFTEEECADEECAEDECPVVTKAVKPEGIMPGETEMDYSPVINEVVKWIENPPTADIRLAAGARAASDDWYLDIARDLFAATYTRVFQISSAGTTFYDGSDMTGSAVISNTQHVWQYYSVDQDKDYYLVQEEIVIPNSGMYQGIWKHYHFPLEWKECGLYMTWVSVDSKLLGENGNPVTLGGTGGGATIPYSSPMTANGITSIESSMSWSLGGIISLGFLKNVETVYEIVYTERPRGHQDFVSKTKGGGIILNGSINFQKSTTNSLTDLSVANYSQSDGANARFDYTTNVVSTYSTGSNTMRPPADLAISTAQFTHYWRWEVHNPKRYNGGDSGGGTNTNNGRFGMSTGFKIQYEEAAAWGGSGSTKRWQLNIEDPPSNFTWWFPGIDRNPAPVDGNN